MLSIDQQRGRQLKSRVILRANFYFARFQSFQSPYNSQRNTRTRTFTLVQPMANIYNALQKHFSLTGAMTTLAQSACNAYSAHLKVCIFKNCPNGAQHLRL